MVKGALDTAVAAGGPARRPGPAAPGGEGPALGAPGSWRRRAWWGLPFVLTALPFAVGVVVALVGVGRDFRPMGDLALTELLTRDVGRHPVTLGPFSRDGWHHPGPALFYVLALPYRLLGSTSGALSAGAVLVAGGSVVGMAAIARRLGGTPFMLCLLVALGALVRVLGFDVLAAPWNPYVTVLPYGLLVMLTWAMVSGERWALPVATVVASFLVQTHVGYAPLALPLLTLGGLWLVVTAVRGRGGAAGDGGAGDGGAGDGGAGDGGAGDGADGATGASSPARRLAGLGAAVLGVGTIAWLPPLVEQVTGDPGNVTAIYRWFRDGAGETRSLVEGWHIVTAQFGLPPEWLVGRAPVNVVMEPAYLHETRPPVLLVVVALAVVAAWRRPVPAARRLTGVWLVASVVGIVAVSRTVGPIYAYRLLWTCVLGAVAGALVLWTVWLGVARRFPGADRRFLVPGALVVVGALAVVDAGVAVRAGTPEQEDSAVMAALVPQVVDALPAGDGPVLVASTSFAAVGPRTGLVLELERRGVDARVLAADTALGEHRRDPGAPRRAVLRIVTDIEILTWIERPTADLVAYEGDLRRDELVATGERLERIDARHTAGELTDAEAVLARRALLPGGGTVAVFRDRS